MKRLEENREGQIAKLKDDIEKSDEQLHHNPTSMPGPEQSLRNISSPSQLYANIFPSIPEDIASAIRTGGLANSKASRIKEVLLLVRKRVGSFDLSFLAEMPLAESKNWLKSLPGVGPKTAAIILCFSLGMPAMPVDTHIFRVSKRLGLIGAKINADDAHDILEPMVDPDEVFAFHMYLKHLNKVHRQKEA